MSEADSTLKQALRSDLTDSIRGRDAVRSSTLRMTLTSITNAEVSGKEARTLSDAEVLTVIAKEAKRRKEASAAYVAAGRPELAHAEDEELAVLQAYLPQQLADDELEVLVSEAIEQTGASSMAQMGAVMKVVQPRVAGRAEGGRIAAAIKRALAAPR